MGYKEAPNMRGLVYRWESASFFFLQYCGIRIVELPSKSFAFSADVYHDVQTPIYRTPKEAYPKVSLRSPFGHQNARRIRTHEFHIFVRRELVHPRLHAKR